MKSSPYIDMALPPGENFNPCVRLIMHSTPVENTDAFVSFQVGAKERIEKDVREMLLRLPEFTEALAQQLWVKGERVTISQLIREGYFQKRRGGQSNMFWIKEQAQHPDHDYWYRFKRTEQTGQHPKTGYSLHQPDSSVARWTVEHLRPQKSEAVNFADFRQITEKGDDIRLIPLVPNPHSKPYTRAYLSLVGAKATVTDAATGKVFRGAFNPFGFLYIEPDNHLLIFADLGVSSQVIEGYEELLKSATYTGFQHECRFHAREVTPAPVVQEDEVLDNPDIVNDDEEEENEDEDDVLDVVSEGSRPRVIAPDAN